MSDRRCHRILAGPVKMVPQQYHLITQRRIRYQGADEPRLANPLRALQHQHTPAMKSMGLQYRCDRAQQPATQQDLLELRRIAFSLLDGGVKLRQAVDAIPWPAH